MRVVLDTRRCIGAAACVSIADDVFTVSEDGIVELIRQPDVAAEERVRDAARACPTGAIGVAED